MSQKSPLTPEQAAALADWNRRVRRLANAYAPKYRPLVLSIGYHTNLEEGQTYVKVDTIVGESARWTASGKPLDTRYAKKLLAEMKAVGALTAEERYRDDTGRQTSSYRSLNTSIAVDRRGKPVMHDFRAPLDESPQVREEKDTPQDTPKDTPGDTPQDTRTSSYLSPDYQGTSNDLSPAARGDGEDRPEPFSGEEEKPGLGNVYIVRTYKSGKQAYARLDRAQRLAAKGVSSEQVVSLSDDEASWMWTAWPAVSPEPPETRRARIGYLLASPGDRAALMEAEEAEAQRQATEQAAREEQKRQEQAEKQRLVREQAKAKAEQDARDRKERDRQERERLAVLADKIEEYLTGHLGRRPDEIAQDLSAAPGDVNGVLYYRETGARFRSSYGVYCLPAQWEQLRDKQDAALEAKEAAEKAAKSEALEQAIRQFVREDGEISTIMLNARLASKKLLSMGTVWNAAYKRVLESGDITIVDPAAPIKTLKWTGSARA